MVYSDVFLRDGIMFTDEDLHSEESNHTLNRFYEILCFRETGGEKRETGSEIRERRSFADLCYRGKARSIPEKDLCIKAWISFFTQDDMMKVCT